MQLSWAGYSTFIGVVLLLTIAPGPDFAVVMKNALAAGRTAGLWTTVRINISNAAQGVGDHEIPQVGGVRDHVIPHPAIT